MRLPDTQLEIAEAVALAVPDCAVVLTCGAPVELPFAEAVRSILLTYLCGDAAAEALAELLSAGKIPPASWPKAFRFRFQIRPHS